MQPRSQGLSSYRLERTIRDPGNEVDKNVFLGKKDNCLHTIYSLVCVFFNRFLMMQTNQTSVVSLLMI